MFLIITILLIKKLNIVLYISLFCEICGLCFQDGRVICSSVPSYGNGNEAGNEAGYIVGMSTCYPKLGSVKIIDGETLTLESNYNNTKEHTGVMGLFYLLVAEQLPYQRFRHSTRSSFFMDINNMLLDD